MKQKQNAILFTMVAVLLIISNWAVGQVDPSLVAWWKFDETGGTTVQDSAKDNNGLFLGDPSRTDGIYGQSLKLDSQGDAPSSKGGVANLERVLDPFCLARGALL